MLCLLQMASALTGNPFKEGNPLLDRSPRGETSLNPLSDGNPFRLGLEEGSVPSTPQQNGEPWVATFPELSAPQSSSASASSLLHVGPEGSSGGRGDELLDSRRPLGSRLTIKTPRSASFSGVLPSNRPPAMGAHSPQPCSQPGSRSWACKPPLSMARVCKTGLEALPCMPLHDFLPL